MFLQLWSVYVKTLPNFIMLKKSLNLVEPRIRMFLIAIHVFCL